MEIIHIVLGKANPERMNGVNKVVFQLAEQQAISGRNVQVWGVTKSLEHNYPERHFKTVLFQAYRNPFKVDTQLQKAILQHAEATFHLHGGWIPLYYSLARFMQQNGIKFILTAHGAYNTIAMQRSAWAKKIYFRFFEQKMLLAAQKIHAIGESEVSGLAAIFPNQKSVILPYGFQGSNNTAPDKRTASQQFVICFMGRLDIYTKGLDLIINAFEQLQKRVPSAALHIIGDGAGRKWLQTKIEQKQLANIKLLGSLFGKNKIQALAQASIFVHASRNEGLPASVLEAADLCIPLVVTRATNVGNYVAQYEAGWQIENESVTQLTEAFCQAQQLHVQNQLTRYGINANTMLRNEFAWQELILKFDQLLYAV